MSFSPRVPAVVAAVLACTAGLAGCGTDDPSCFFGPGSCQGGSGPGALGEAATLPTDGAWILDGDPVVEQFRPNSNGAHANTPITLRFSESMSASSLGQSLASAFDLIEVGANGIPSPFPVLFTQSLQSDGRLLVLLPAQPLKPSTTYQIRAKADAKIKDLTGQLLVTSSDKLLGTFTVAATNPTEPRVLTTFPADDAINTSWSPELVVVFDQPIDAASVTSQSWIMQIDGADPVPDPDPTPLTTLSPLPTTDTRIWTWKSEDSDGIATPYGPSAEFELELSPAAHPITNANGDELATTFIDFESASFDAPQAASLLSTPTDAIGIPNLTLGSGNELALGAQLAGAQSGDVVTLFLFGTSTATPPKLFALLRQKVLSSAPFDSVIVEAQNFDLVAGTNPLTAKFADGELAVALRLRRGSVVSPLHVLDVDLDAAGAQHALLDTVAPTLSEVFTSAGATTSFRSEQRGLSFAGRASEPPARVTVVTPLGDNLAAPEVLGAAADGTFLASPIAALDLIDPADLPLDYVVTVYDHALNASAPLNGQYRQVGVVGPAHYLLGDPLEVEVVDAVTLAPIEGALVLTHADDGATWPLVDNQLTGPDGIATIGSDSVFETILTVDAPDIGSAHVQYDLFSFHGVTSSRISIALTRAALDPPTGVGTAAGTITTTGTIAALTLSLLGRRVSDSRRDPFEPRTLASPSCTSLPFGGGPLTCPFGPYEVRAHRLGASTLIAGAFAQTLTTFNPGTLIQGFELDLPLERVADEGVDALTIDVPQMLIEPGVPAIDLPVQAPNLNLFAFFTQGIDLANLVDDAALDGAPLVTVEGLVPGLPSSVVVGLGLAYDQGSLLWSVRSAYAGKASAVGELVTDGVLDPDLFLRGEIRDVDGNVAGQRRRISNIGQFQPFPNYLFPASVAHVLAPATGGTTGGAAFTLTIDNSIEDIQAEPGLYRVTLLDATGRRWSHVRADPPDAAGGTLDLRVVDIAADGGQPLADGPIEAVVESLGWPGFDASAFLWSDLEREYDLFSRSAGVSFTQD
ncbi:MAG: hypothetical protein EPO68_04630 [Planctomycetota bacterium]|nr:MAG: hypothetical protein EPO68_04630 [Planctomycetota bacterium]